MFLYNREQLSQYLKQVFILLFQRLTSSKTTKYVKGELFVTAEVSFFRAGDLQLAIIAMLLVLDIY